MDRQGLLAEVDAAQKRHGISDTAFGIAALNDSGFVFDLKSGRRNFRVGTTEKVLAYIEKLNAIQSVRTQDGTVIVYDPMTGTSASGRTLDEAMAELRRLLSERQAA